MVKFWVIFVASILILLPILCNLFSFESLNDQRILVLVDDFAIKSSHSIYFNSLKSRSFDLDFKLADDPNIDLQRYSQYRYDALSYSTPLLNALKVLSVSPSAYSINPKSKLSIPPSLTSSAISLVYIVQDVGNECGVDFDEDSSAMVTDHTRYAVSET